MRKVGLLLGVLVAAGVATTGPVFAQDTPRPGGELVFVVGNEFPSFDGHREESFGLMEAMAPHYSTLVRTDPADRTGTRIVGDVAESWDVAKDGLTYTFTVRRGMLFHDGSELTARDVKATYDKIIFPPPHVASIRKSLYQSVETVQAPDPHTVVFKLKWPTASFLALLASPYNWIYKADILAKDMRWYEKNVMGSGPFTFVEYVRGSHWIGRKNPRYWDKGKPYLDSYRALFVADAGARVAAIRSERAMVDFRGLTPMERDTLVQVLGSKITVQESPWACAPVVSMNHEKKPFDDRRVRRALTLAIDRYQGSKTLSRISILKDVMGVQTTGSPFATPPSELEKIAGYWPDIAKSRAEAKRLLREAGVPEGFSFTFLNRGLPMPNGVVAVWLIDQWRQIGLNVSQREEEASTYFQDLRGGNFEVAIDTRCATMVEPDSVLFGFLSVGINPRNSARYADTVLDGLYQKESRAVDPEERRKYIREFERRLLDEEVHYLFLLQYHRIVPQNARLRGWTLTPSHLLNQQLDTVWLSK
jgi:peptide/nickel transport system substrate-binding protein